MKTTRKLFKDFSLILLLFSIADLIKSLYSLITALNQPSVFSELDYEIVDELFHIGDLFNIIIFLAFLLVIIPIVCCIYISTRSLINMSKGIETKGYIPASIILSVIFALILALSIFGLVNSTDVQNSLLTLAFHSAQLIAIISYTVIIIIDKKQSK
ncbi:MAG: hypothetical protein E7595_02560 [Ruminococcaceae bacterium]|nr:hypothetical protein [Oscillospiraceae bacterium]